MCHVSKSSGSWPLGSVTCGIDARAATSSYFHSPFSRHAYLVRLGFRVRVRVRVRVR